MWNLFWTPVIILRSSFPLTISISFRVEQASLWWLRCYCNCRKIFPSLPTTSSSIAIWVRQNKIIEISNESLACCCSIKCIVQRKNEVGQAITKHSTAAKNHFRLYWLQTIFFLSIQLRVVCVRTDIIVNFLSIHPLPSYKFDPLEVVRNAFVFSSKFSYTFWCSCNLEKLTVYVFASLSRICIEYDSIEFL